ncbi:MAG TPA: c-type cytochrome [Acidimicrobiia bacterium]|nr:c-type cytochrome [Acidimicrobiia bacterium]
MASSARAAQESGEPPATDRRLGVHLYLRDCAVCHGDEGRGTPRGPDLSGVGAASVDFQLRTGRMPITGPNQGLFRPDDPEYSEAEIEALVIALQSVVAGGPPIPRLVPGDGDVPAGGTLYREHCAGCHGTAGVGGALIFTDQVAPAVDHLTPRLVAEAILVGPGTMPVMSPAPLDEEGVRDVTAYVDTAIDDRPDPGGFSLWHLGPVPEGAAAWLFGVGGTLLIARWIGSTMRHGHGGHGVEPE